MYSSFTLLKKYLRYRFDASNAKGHGVHSPFVFNFIDKILRDRKNYAEYDMIEPLRDALLNDSRTIQVEDHGAGSSVIQTKERRIRDIAASSLKSKKFARLLFRYLRHYQPQHIIELGTSFGITTAYMASAAPSSKIYTCEGAPEIAKIASSNFEKLGLKNVELVQGNFDTTLPDLLKRIDKIDLAFIDGNHRKEATLNYFGQMLTRLNQEGVLIFDDIHWSAGMEEAWDTIKKHPAVTLTIDLFFIGLVFIDPAFKFPQHFRIRF